MHLLLEATRLLIQIIAVVVLLSYTLVWYENANLDPKLIAGRFTLRKLLLAVRLIVSETLLLCVTVISDLFGWIGSGQITAHPAARPPILLLHGLFHNQGCWWYIKLQLHRQGFNSIHSLNLPPWKNAEELTELIAKKVDALRHATGSDKVTLVGHSLGGVLARNYLQLRGGEQKVSQLILLGAPNHGSKLVPFALTKLSRILLPNSEFLARLNAAPWPADVPVTNIYTRHDNMVVPNSLCHLNQSVQIELENFGHIGLLYHPAAVTRLLAALRLEAP